MDAIAILDRTASCLISRSYTGTLVDVETVVRAFCSAKEQNDAPVVTVGEFRYAYITNNDLILLAIVHHDNTNAMMLFSFLYKFDEILKSYFKTKDLNRDLITDNFNLIYELLDEIMDYGIPQLTDIPILRDVIKLEVQQNEEEAPKPADDDDQQVNSSILKTTTTSISWRPRGIFYKKNELFVDVVEKISLYVDANSRVIRHEIHGSIDVKCYLSGMPVLKLGLNKLIDTENSAFFKKLQFHQCVELPKFSSDRIISFTPPDGEFQLCHYSLTIKTSPIVEIIENEFIEKSGKLFTKITIRTNFKLRAQLTYLCIKIPIDLQHYDIDFGSMPKFRCKLGKVAYKFDDDCIVWNLQSVGGERTYTMMSQFDLKRPDDNTKVVNLGMDPPPKITHPRFDKIKEIVDEENERETNNKEITMAFELPDLTFSSLKVEYLSITDDVLEYTSFPWVRYKTLNADYVYRL